jgi:NitT/TauT family transport system ATP-binding protein
VKDFSLKVNPGEFVTIVGPSGCGKSTVIRMLDGIITPTSGNILIDGEDFSEKKVDRETLKKIGFIFQEPNLLPWLTVEQNVELPLKIMHMNTPENKVRVKELIDMVGMSKYASAYPVEVSGGMTQRVGVIRAMIHNPEILLMDEPFGALDSITREQLNLELLQIWKKTHKTIIFITHNVEEAVLLSSRVYVMATGPGRLTDVVDIDLPRPRTLDMITDKKFIAYTKQLTNLIGKIDLSKIV